MGKTFDAIVAGAGVWGCTVARRLADAGRRVLVLEKRKAVGGNCRCRTENGIEIHLYGSHIFHTSDETVWSFVNRFTAFNDYRHTVWAKTRKSGGGRTRTADDFHIYHLPIGCTLLKEFFGRDLKPSELTDAERGQLFDAFIRGYTSKQWGVPPEKVDPSIIARLKVRDTFSTDYFDDPHQGIPLDGYNALFARMLDHPHITVKTGCELRLKPGDDGFEILDHKRNAVRPLFGLGAEPRLYYSGPIDRLFHDRFGHLPWRSLRFETENLPQRDYQGTTVVNYTDAAVPFTRIHEFRHYHPERQGEFAKPRGTIVTREYPADWQPGDEPYYPIDTPDSRALLARYRELAATIPNLVIGGRLGEYKYYDMDKSIVSALTVGV